MPLDLNALRRQVERRAERLAAEAAELHDLARLIGPAPAADFIGAEARRLRSSVVRLRRQAEQLAAEAEAEQLAELLDLPAGDQAAADQLAAWIDAEIARRQAAEAAEAERWAQQLASGRPIVIDAAEAAEGDT